MATKKLCTSGHPSRAMEAIRPGPPTLHPSQASEAAVAARTRATKARAAPINPSGPPSRCSHSASAELDRR